MEILNLFFLLSFLSQGIARGVNTLIPSNVLEIPIKLYRNGKLSEEGSKSYDFNGVDFERPIINRNLLNIHDDTMIELGRHGRNRQEYRSSKTLTGYSTEKQKANESKREVTLADINHYVPGEKIGYLTRTPQLAKHASTKRLANFMDWINFYGKATSKSYSRRTRFRSRHFLTLPPNRNVKETTTPQQGVLMLQALDLP